MEINKITEVNFIDVSTEGETFFMFNFKTLRARKHNINNMSHPIRLAKNKVRIKLIRNHYTRHLP